MTSKKLLFLFSVILSSQIHADEDIRPDACLRTINGVVKEFKCTDYSKLASKSNICFFKSGIWNYGTYTLLTKKYKVNAVCDAGIKTRLVPSSDELQAKGTSILPLTKGNPILPFGMNDLYRETFGISVSVGERSSVKSKADVAIWSKKRALAVYEGLTGVSATLIPLSRKDQTAEQKLITDSLIKSDIKNFASCVVIDDFGITKSVSTCVIQTLAYDSKQNLSVTYPAGSCYPHYVTVKKVTTNWWVRKKSEGYTICTGGLQIKPAIEGEEVTE